jgi:hypothetical protein
MCSAANSATTNALMATPAKPLMIQQELIMIPVQYPIPATEQDPVILVRKKVKDDQPAPSGPYSKITV